MIKFLVAFYLLVAPLSAALQGPLQPPSAPPENPFTPEKAVLGKMLFFEEQLSSDNTISCATCHSVNGGFTDLRDGAGPGPDGIMNTADDLFTSLGVRRADINGDFAPDSVFGFDVQLTGRSTQDVFAALYAPEAFWDGRATDSFVDPQTGLISIASGGALESQAVGPIMSDSEMAHEDRDWGMLTAKLATVRPMALASNLTPDISSALLQDSNYPDLFNRAFGSTSITAERVAYAIATYERTLVPNQTPWDLQMGGNQGSLTMNQMQGMMQFMNQANCHECHSPPLFSDNLFHNNGLRPISDDNGRQGVTGLYEDRGKFKTPSLRNAGLRSSFFHTGQALALEGGSLGNGVDDIYLAGGGPNADNRDPLLVPLTNVNMSQVMDFVGNALTDPRVANGLHPFDAPTLFSESNPDGNAATLYGIGNPGGNNVIPRLLIATPAAFGSTSFKIGIIDAPTTASIAILAVSLNRSSGVWQNGLLVNLQRPIISTVISNLTGNGLSDGHATFHIDIPDFSSLQGVEVNVQGFVPDRSAVGGRAASTLGASYIIL